MVCSASYAAKPLSKQGKRVAKALMSTDPNEWQLVESIDLKFDTYHPQGMLKVDDTFYITTVKVERRPRYTRQGKQVSVMDEGAGKGYLMQFDAGGNLLKCIELCEGTIFHPGGMDFDGRYIWVPITKYYPYSRSLIVRVDVRSHQVEKVCYVDDSIGADKKQLAYKLTFMDSEKTLESADVEKVIKSILNRLEFTYKATLRQ